MGAGLGAASHATAASGSAIGSGVRTSGESNIIAALFGASAAAALAATAPSAASGAASFATSKGSCAMFGCGAAEANTSPWRIDADTVASLAAIAGEGEPPMGEAPAV